MAKKRKKAAPLEDPDVVEGMEFLPDWMRWSAMHPGLLFGEAAVEEDLALKRICNKYERSYPCPHQAAMNKFRHYRGNSKKIDEMYKEIARLHIAAVRVSKMKGSENPVDMKEEKAIVTLEKLFKEALSA